MHQKKMLPGKGEDSFPKKGQVGELLRWEASTPGSLGHWEEGYAVRQKQSD